MLDKVLRRGAPRCSWIGKHARSLKIAACIVVPLGILGAGIALGFFFDKDPRVPGARPPFVTMHGPTAGRLADQFRPILLFSSNERWRPLNIERFLGENGPAGPHRLCTSGGLCQPVGGRDGLESTAAAADLPTELGSYLDLAGDQPNGVDAQVPGSPGCRQYRPPRTRVTSIPDCDAGAPSSIYYRVSRANERYYIDYWWFFRYNDYPVEVLPKGPCKVIGLQLCADHEGDWEGITVVTPGTETIRLWQVGFAQHKGIVRASWEQMGPLGTTPARVEIVSEKGPDYEYQRPVVYIAAGTHAAYPEKCATGCKIGSTIAPEGKHDGSIPWERNPLAGCKTRGGMACLIELPDFSKGGTAPWSLWAGEWGVRADPKGLRLDQGPRSPGWQLRYSAPDCYGTALGNATCDNPAAPVK